VTRGAATPNTLNRLTRSAGVVSLATLASRVLGLVRDLALAFHFGANNVMDAFYVACRIPNLTRDLFAEGAMSSVFVPALARRLTTDGREAAWELGRQLITALVAVTVGVVLLGMVFARPLTALMAREFGEVPGKLELTVHLTRVMLPFLPLVAIAAVCMGMLNSMRRLFVPALSPALYNVSLIFSAVVLVPLMPHTGLEPIVAITVGVLVGGAGQIATQAWVLHREGFRYRPRFDPADRELRAVLALMGPTILAGAAMQVNLIVDTILATGQGSGAVSWLTYAFRLTYLPIGVVGVSISTAALPVLSRHVALGELAAVRRTMSDALRLMLMIMVPAAVGLTVLAVPIVRLIFERGQFTSADTQATAAALAAYAPGMVGYSAVRLCVPGLYALGTNLTPAVVSVATILVNLGLNLVLVRLLGYPGLALGTSLAAMLNATILALLLRHRLGGLDGGRLLGGFIRIAVASVVMGLSVCSAERWLASYWLVNFWKEPPGDLLSALVIGVEILLGVFVFTFTARLLGLEELDQVKRELLAKLRFRRRLPTGPT